MRFEDLTRFFGPTRNFLLSVKKNCSSGYIRFLECSDGERIVFRYANDPISVENMKHAILSDNETQKLREAIESSNDYLAKITSSYDGHINVSIIVFNKIVSREKYEIGVGDMKSSIAKSFNDIKSDIENNYLIDVYGEKYFVFARHIHGNEAEKSFSIVGLSEKYDVVQARRGECGAVYDKSIINDTIFAIVKPSSRYKVADYVYEMRPAVFDIKDVSSAAAATEQNKVEQSTASKDDIIHRWESFALKDLEISKREADKIGVIGYYNAMRVEKGYQSLSIEPSYAEKFKLFVKYAEENGEGLMVQIADEPSQFDAVKKRKKLLSFVRISGNSLILNNTNGDVDVRDRGYFRISTIGSEIIYDRRARAFEKITSSTSAKPNLSSLIQGKPLMSEAKKSFYSWRDFEKEIREQFGGKLPNPAQLDAIDAALNTPDFAIIQGPPGCGKTSLMNAIDACLTKIDSSKHAFGLSLSTAYQKESAKNMVAKKVLNGIPVPFISSKYDRQYIEDNFEENINELSDALSKKYPELVEEIEKKDSISKLTVIQSRFQKDGATYTRLIEYIDDILTVDSFTFDERRRLNEIRSLALNARDKVLAPESDDSLYYVRMIPSSAPELEDDGRALFVKCKTMIEIFKGNSFNDYLSKITKELESSTPNFNLIKALKNEIIFQIKNKVVSTINQDWNNEVYSLVDAIIERIYEESNKDEESVIAEFVRTVLTDPIRYRQALEPWVTSIGATHQISVEVDKIRGLYSDMDKQYENVLVDEAARSCPPDLLIPLSCAKNRIIMVGDHKQLPQFVNEEVLAELDFDANIKDTMKNVSMFEYLIDSCKKLTEQDGLDRFVVLNQQFRMPKVIGDFISDEFYHDTGLSSPRGNPDADPNFRQTMPYVSGKCMVWCDVNNTKEISSNGYYNEDEAQVIAKMVKDMLEDKDNENLEIGVMSFYRLQLTAIKKALCAYGIVAMDEGKYRINHKYAKRLKIDTVDAFQGLQHDISILSMVRSDSTKRFASSSFGFLRDDRRLCVALSRQKRCLVVVGNGKGMLQTKTAERGVKALNDLYKMCTEGGEYLGYISSKDIPTK